MNRTIIEWCDYSWNPITGCKGRCWYCYARKLAWRFGKTEDAKNFKPTFHPKRLNEPDKVKKPSKIFTCSVSDFFARWTDPIWQYEIIQSMERASWHTFQVLTKQYKNLFPMPDNVWIGVSITNRLLAQEAINYLKGPRTGNNLKFISFEPLMDNIYCDLDGIDWVIIGKLTGAKKRFSPKSFDNGWVETILTEAKNHNIPVFLKNNLEWNYKRQEFPIKSLD